MKQLPEIEPTLDELQEVANEFVRENDPKARAKLGETANYHLEVLRLTLAEFRKQDE